MSNSFNDTLLAHFEATGGGFSHVTPDEFDKQQVTLVGPEQVIAEKLIPDIALRVGTKKAMKAAGLDPQVQVRRWGDGEIINLTFYYKVKKGKKSNELRMYLNRDFKPNPDVNWCIFEKDDQLWVGQFSSDAFELPKEETNIVDIPRPLLEPETDNYQAAINSGTPAAVQSVITKWKRNPKIGAQAIKAAGYKCEVEPDAPTFNSRFTNKPFMEAHHLVPMKIQSDFKNANLDSIGNICSLGPMIHRKLHFAPIADIGEILSSLHNRKKLFMDELGVTVEDLLKIYDA